MRRVDDEVQQFVVRRVDVQHIHARCGHHHVTSGHVGDADHPFEHHARFGVDDVVVFGLGERLDQLVRGVWSGVDELCKFLQEATFVDMPQAALRPQQADRSAHLNGR